MHLDMLFNMLCITEHAYYVAISQSVRVHVFYFNLGVRPFGTGYYGKPRVKCSSCKKTFYTTKKYLPPGDKCGKERNLRGDLRVK